MRNLIKQNLLQIGTLLSILVLFFVVPHQVSAGWLDIFTTPGDFVLRIVSTSIELVVLPLAAGIMYLSGLIMDAAINFSLNTAYIFSLSPAINLGWVIVRDLANMFFIFILIYISLGTIIQGTKFGTKQLLTQVIIAAILINFSLFITKAVIDVSNVFGNWLYGGIQKTLIVNSEVGAKTSLSGLIATRMNILGFWSAEKTDANTGANLATGSSNSMIGRFLRLTVVLVTTYIFLYSAVLFISRSITLLFLLVFSPIGFMGGVLPQLKKYAGDWKNELIAAATFPIAFLLMLYIALQFINGLKLGLDTTEVQIFGSGFKVSDYFQYFIIIFLLQACLKIAKENAGELGKQLGGMAEGLGKMAVGAAVGIGAGGVALGMRSIVAGVSAGGGKNEDGSSKGFSAFKSTLRAGTPLWRSTESLKDKAKDAAKKGSWDFRNLPTGGGGNMGQLLGSTTGIKGLEAKSAKDIEKESKEFKAEFKVEKSQESLLKDLVRIADEEKNLENKKSNLEAALLSGDTTKIAAAQTEYDTAQNSVWSVQDKITKNLGSMSNKDLEKLDEDTLGDANVLKHMTASQVDYLSDKSEISGAVKGKIKAARYGDIKKALKDGAAPDVIKKALRGLTDRELKNLDPEILANEEYLKLLANPEAMGSSQFTKIIESDSVGAGTKNRIKQARYSAVKNAVTGSPGDVAKELDKFSDAEIGKIDADVLTNDNVIKHLTPARLDKIQGELDKPKRDIIKAKMLASADVDSKVKDWFDSGRGKMF